MKEQTQKKHLNKCKRHFRGFRTKQLFQSKAS